MTSDYLKTLYGETNDGWLVVWQKHSPSAFFPISEMERAEAFMLAASATNDTYFGWGLQSQKLTSGRGTSDTASGVPGVFMDIDVWSPIKGVHSKNEHLPKSYQDVLDFITQELDLPEPAAIRGSGNGYYFDWLFEQPWVFKDEDERAAAQRLSADLQELIIVATNRKFGWKLDNTSDLARVTRLPGTLNHKTAPPKEVTLIRLDESLRIPPDDLREAVNKARERQGMKAKVPAVSRRKSEARGAREWDGPVPDYESIKNGCSYFGYLEANKAHLSEEDWYRSASITPRCKDGVSKFHEFSSADPRYDYAETQAKIEHALEYGPRTCADIKDKGNHSGCATCPFYGSITSPIQLGLRSPELVKIMANHVFDLGTNRYIALDDFTPYDMKTMNNRYAAILKSPHRDIIEDIAMKQVSRVEYLPGETALFVQEGRHTILNTWRPGAVEPVAGDCSILLSHLEYLFSEEDRNHILNALAHSLQKPKEKIRHALIVCGSQGTGKSFLGRIMKHMFGEKNVKIVGAETFTDRWTGDLGGCQALIGEELDAFHMRESYEKMKVLISEEIMQVEQKHLPKYNATTPRIIVLFTNHPRPISLPDGDRRFYVARSEAQPRDSAYYQRLFSEGIEQVPAFMHYLLGIDLTEFFAEAPPPLNAAKRDLIKQSRPPLVQIVERLVADEEGPFHRDLIRRMDAFNALKTHYTDYRLSETSVSNAFVDLGYAQVPQMRLPDGRKVRLWCVRNPSKWMSATPEEVQAELMRCA